MYINGIVIGVFVTLFVEMAIGIVGSIVVNIYAFNKKNHKGGKYNG